MHVRRPEEARERLYPDGRLGGLWFDGPAPAPLGSAVEVEVRLSALGDSPGARHFTVRGVLAWARHQGGPGLPPSYGVAFSPDDAGSRQRLLAWALRTVDADRARAFRRHLTELPVTLEVGTNTLEERLSDLSEGGAFVRTRLLLPAGTAVRLAFRPPGALLKVRLEGRVAWTRADGEHSGLGIAFAPATGRHRERLKRLLVRLEHPAA